MSFLMPHDPEQIHRQRGHFADQIPVFLFSTVWPAGEHCSSPEWYWTFFHTVAHKGDDLHGRGLFPIPAEVYLETDKYVLE